MGNLNLVLIMLGIVGFLGLVEAQLELGYYAQSCPRAEEIVQNFVHKHIPNAPSLAAPLLRMQFHDCFVRGCDASVLLNVTKVGNNDTEKTANPNLSLRGFGFIDGVKSLLEAECPGVVSCADIIALVARDAVWTIGGPWWAVPTGRRDGVISNATEALQNIPPPFSNFSGLQTIFASKGLDLKDLVLLSGHNPTPGSFRTFDLSYYKLLLKRRGLFESDAALTTSFTTLSYIKQLVNGPLETFFAEFGQSMVKMGQVEVLTGSAGEIRKQCAFVN